MVFRRKKNQPVTNGPPTAMRGRDRSERKPDSSVAASQNPLARRFQADEEPDTIDLDQPARFREQQENEPEGTTTRLLAADQLTVDAPEQEPLEDPVAGFLVVIEGPGRGSVTTLGYGMNSIGREPSQRVSLDHGDLGISRTHHCTVTFDPLAGKFYLQPGEGRNLTYLDEDPVLAPVELNAGHHIRLGATVLRFVPLCGKGFSWEA